MSSRPESPWEIALLRALQSWRDTADAAAHDPRAQDECEYCEGFGFIELIPKKQPWPHWMRHGLRERLHELRSDELFVRLDEPFEGSALGSGYGRDPRRTLLVDDYMRLWDMWLRERLSSFEDWERRVLFAKGQPRGHEFSVARIVDAWIPRVESWRREERERRDEREHREQHEQRERHEHPEHPSCEFCTAFFLVDAVAMPDWLPHSLAHALADDLAGLMTRYSPYDWRQVITGVFDHGPWLTEEDEYLAERRRSWRLEYEELYFRDLLLCAPRIEDALGRVLSSPVE